MGSSKLVVLRDYTLGDCTRCRLHKTRQHIVFGEGDINAQLMLVGEGPGANEDRTGRPFVGPAGAMLDKLLRYAGVRRSEVYIANVVKCRPPQNRVPLIDEVQKCAPFLFQQIDLIQPKVIVALGSTASRALVGRFERGKKGRYGAHGHIPVFMLWHPAYLLRDRSKIRIAKKDMERVRVELWKGTLTTALRPVGTLPHLLPVPRGDVSTMIDDDDPGDENVLDDEDAWYAGWNPLDDFRKD